MRLLRYKEGGRRVSELGKSQLQMRCTKLGTGRKIFLTSKTKQAHSQQQRMFLFPEGISDSLSRQIAEQ